MELFYVKPEEQPAGCFFLHGNDSALFVDVFIAING
jgi:hypothetical protein